MYVRDFDFLSAKPSVSILSVIIQDDSMYCGVLGKDRTMYAHKSFANLTYNDEQYFQKLKSEKIFAQDFDQVLVTIMNHKYYVLPKVNNQLDQVIDSLSYKRVFVDKIAGVDAYNHFGISSHQVRSIETIAGMKTYKIHHFANTLALYYLHHPGNIIHVHVEQNELHIYVQKNGVFIVYRCVEAVSIEDILYFILAFYQECGLDCATDMLTLSGWLAADSALFMQIYGYIAKVHWVDDATFRLSGQTSDATKDHFYFAHFANSLCAS
jgi:hypothetical protein